MESTISMNEPFCVSKRTLKGDLNMEKALEIFDQIIERTSSPIRKIYFLLYCIGAAIFFVLAAMNRGYENIGIFTLYFMLSWLLLIRPMSVCIRLWSDQEEKVKKYGKEGVKRSHSRIS